MQQSEARGDNPTHFMRYAVCYQRPSDEYAHGAVVALFQTEEHATAFAEAFKSEYAGKTTIELFTFSWDDASRPDWLKVVPLTLTIPKTEGQVKLD